MAPLDYRHAKVQRLRRLIARRSARDAESVVVVEGAKVLSEALAARDGSLVVESVFVAPGGGGPLVDAAYERGARIYDLAPGVMERVADTVTPQPVLGVVQVPDATLDDLPAGRLVMVLVDVRDPGNAGAVLRSAEASGAGGLVSCDGTVDVRNPKCVRASAGALFHVPVVRGGDPAMVLEELGKRGWSRLGTAAGRGTPYTEADLGGSVAIVLGNEAQGLSEQAASHLDGWLTIPMAGRAESLNVGMAASVLCFEAARQRSLVAKP